MIKMRRVPAILLLFVVGFLPIAPALLVDAESTLPACCRRGVLWTTALVTHSLLEKRHILVGQLARPGGG